MKLRRTIIVGALAVTTTVPIAGSAHAASPWKELWRCQDSDSSFTIHEGSQAYVESQDALLNCQLVAPAPIECVHASGAQGVTVFRDANDNDLVDPGEALRCAMG